MLGKGRAFRNESLHGSGEIMSLTDTVKRRRTSQTDLLSFITQIDVGLQREVSDRAQ